MGIIALCPNQHRIKVKDHLAGKKGICPHCGARFRIPRESAPAAPARPSLPAAATPGPVAAAAADSTPPPLARFVSQDEQWAATLPRALPLADS